MKIICVGMNYSKHNKELGCALLKPESPVIFMKPDSSILRNRRPFFLPDYLGRVDYETELVVRINRLGKSISARFADRYIDAVTLGIDLYDEENAEVDSAALFRTLFDGNPIIDSIQTKTDPTGTDWHYVLFKPEVIQFYDDDLNDHNGNWNGLAEDIAREVFEENARGVNFCTAPTKATEAKAEYIKSF